MSLAILFTTFLLFTQPSYENELVEQATQYLEGISSKENNWEHYWALNEIFQSSCGVNNTVLRVIINSEANNVKDYFLKTPCGLTPEEKEANKINRVSRIALNEGVWELSINYLLNETDTQKRLDFHKEYYNSWGASLTEAKRMILEKVLNETQFNIEEIPESSKEFVLYSILYGYKTETFFPSVDLNEIVQNWYQNFDSVYPTKNLKSSIQASNISFILYDLDRYVELHNFVPNIIDQKNFPHSIQELRYLNAIAYSFYVVGRYDESLRIIRDYQVPLSLFLDDKVRLEQANFFKGINLYSIGKFREAKEVFEAIYYDPASSIGKASLFNNLSICYLKLGEKNKYANYLLEALSQDGIDENYKVKLTILRNLVSYYSSINDYNSALTHLRSAEQIALGSNDYFEVASIRAFTGLFYWDTQQNAELALKELRIASTAFDVDNDYYSFTGAIINQSEIYTQIDSLEQAISSLNELKAIALSKSDTPNYLYALISMAQISLTKGEYSNTTTLLQEISVYPLDNLDFETLVKYSWIRSQLEFITKNKREAFQNLEPIVEQVIERARTSIDTQTGFWTIEQEYIDAFNTIIAMLINLGEKEKAVQLLDEIKTINDAALYNSPILRADKLTEEDLAQDRLLNNEIQSLRTKYLNSSSSTERFNLKSEIDILSARREDVLNKIRTELPDNSISVWNIQRKLSDDDLVIHYTEIGDKLYSSYITNQDIDIEVIDLDKDLKRLLKESADNLGSGKTDLSQLYSIYSRLNLNNNILLGAQKITVIPDNYLYRIPIEILPKTNPSSPTSYGSASYLLEDFHFEYFSSLNELINNSRDVESNATTDFSAFAISDFSELRDDLPSLPYATQEVRNIDLVLSSDLDKTTYLENNATKEAFIRDASSSRIVHIATHSEISEQDPLFSTIYLNDSVQNSDDSNSGTLYAYELFNTRMNSDLIMLNSCSSGSGEFLQGSGIMGISRALRYAGAKSLALNLWSVNDKVASEFATEFYSSIDKGFSKSEAMRHAKLNLLKTGNANPHYWGAYMLIGNPSPLIPKSQQVPAFYILF